VGRKVPEEHRDALRQLVQRHWPGSGPGVVVRGFAVGRPEAELADELRFLLRLWVLVGATADATSAPALVYRERDPVRDFLRPQLPLGLDAIHVDASPHQRDRVRAVAEVVRPGAGQLVRDCIDKETLFSRFGIREAIPLSTG
jgi:Ribonuclease G/E